MQNRRLLQPPLQRLPVVRSRDSHASSPSELCRINVRPSIYLCPLCSRLSPEMSYSFPLGSSRTMKSDAPSSPHGTSVSSSAPPSPPLSAKDVTTPLSPRIEQKTPWTHVVSGTLAVPLQCMTDCSHLRSPKVNAEMLNRLSSSGEPLVIPGLTDVALAPASSPHMRSSVVEIAAASPPLPSPHHSRHHSSNNNASSAENNYVPSAATTASVSGTVVPPLALRQSPSLSAIQRKPSLKNARHVGRFSSSLLSVLSVL